MVLIRNCLVFLSLYLLSFTFLTEVVSSPLDSSAELSIEETKPNADKLLPRVNSKAKSVLSFPNPKDNEASGGPEEVCARKHKVCRIGGPKRRLCCGEGVKLFCRVGYGEYFCFEKWESTA